MPYDVMEKRDLTSFTTDDNRVIIVCPPSGATVGRKSEDPLRSQSDPVVSSTQFADKQTRMRSA